MNIKGRDYILLGLRESNNPDAPSICLDSNGGKILRADSQRRPMYKDLEEVIQLIGLLIENKYGGRIDDHRTIESGAMVEHVVTRMEASGKKLLFRVWPVFFARFKRLDYKIYADDPEIRTLIEHYLGICAEMNEATLLLKP